MARILVVSDDADERSRAVNAVALVSGASATAVATTDEFRVLLRADHEFDLAVIDGDLQPRGGYAALYDARAQWDFDGRPAIPAILLGARTTDEWLARWAGASRFVLKPADVFALAADIEQTLGTAPAHYGDAGATAAQLAAVTRDHQR